MQTPKGAGKEVWKTRVTMAAVLLKAREEAKNTRLEFSNPTKTQQEIKEAHIKEVSKVRE